MTASRSRRLQAERPQRLTAFPATIALTILVIIAGISTAGMTPSQHADLLARIGLDVSDFDARRVLAMPLATFVQSSPGVGWSMLLLVAAPLAVLEWLIGTTKAALTFLLSDWISAPLTLIAIWALARAGSSQAMRLLHEPDAGSSAAAHGTIAAVCMLMPGRWRYASLALFMSIDIAAFTFERLDAALAHLLATLVGAGIGFVWLRRSACIA